MKLWSESGELEVDEASIPENLRALVREQNKVYAQRQAHTTAANKRFEEAARLRKEADDRAAAYDADPFAAAFEAAQRKGIDPNRIILERAAQLLQLEQMPPEQRRAMEAEHKAAEYQKQLEAIQAEKQQAESQRMQQAHAERLDTMFTEAFKARNLPKTPQTLSRMARITQEAIQRGIPLGPQDLAEAVEEDIVAEQQSLLGSYEGPQLLARLGPQVVEKVRKALLAAHLAKRGQPATTVAPKVQTTAPSEPKVLTSEEWEKQMTKRLAGM